MDSSVISKVQYFLPPKRFITWPYIIQVLKGEKILLKQADIRINVVPPKIKQLTVKELWGVLKTDYELLKYFPNLCAGMDPPRNYFFAIISVIRPNILLDLLNRAETAFMEKQAEFDNVIEINPTINTELNNIQWRFSILGSKMDQRVSTRERNH